MDHPTRVTSTNTSLWDWLLWWRVDPGALERQVLEYHTLKLWQSMRGISVLCLGLSIAMTCLFAFLSVLGFNASAFIDAALMAVWAVFIYFGHRWAMAAAMVLWTIEKVLPIVDEFGAHQFVGTNIFTQLLWWAAYMHAFYFAFRIEQQRRVQKKAVDVTVFS